MHVEVEGVYAPWHFSIILISLSVEVAQISDFLVHAKILPLRKAFFRLKFSLRKKDIALIFFYIRLAMACSKVAAFLVFCKLMGHIIFRMFSSQCHNSLVFAARQIANNLSPIAKKI